MIAQENSPPRPGVPREACFAGWGCRGSTRRSRRRGSGYLEGRRGAQASVREVEPLFDLPDLLVHHRRRVTGVELVVLVLLAKFAQTAEVILDLPDRAARVVPTGHDQQRHLQPVRVGDRGALAVQLGPLGRGAPEQRPVERLERLHLVLERGHVVGHWYRRHAQPPGLWLPSEPEQRQIASP